MNTKPCIHLELAKQDREIAEKIRQDAVRQPNDGWVEALWINVDWFLNRARGREFDHLVGCGGSRSI